MNQNNSNNLSFLEEQVTQLLQGEQSSTALTAGSVWGVEKVKKWSGSGSFQCPGCGKVYRWRKNMVSHMRLECGKGPQFQCPHCPQRTTQKSSLLTHIYNKHRQWNCLLWVAVLRLWCTEQTNSRYSVAFKNRKILDWLTSIKHCFMCILQYRRMIWLKLIIL